MFNTCTFFKTNFNDNQENNNLLAIHVSLMSVIGLNTKLSRHHVFGKKLIHSETNK